MNLNDPRFVVTTGPHDMPSLVLSDPSPQERDFVGAAVRCNLMDDPRYLLGQDAGAFLQCDSKEYVLVEFWNKNYKPFMQWLNDNFGSWAIKWKEENERT